MRRGHNRSNNGAQSCANEEETLEEGIEKIEESIRLQKEKIKDLNSKLRKENW